MRARQVEARLPPIRSVGVGVRLARLRCRRAYLPLATSTSTGAPGMRSCSACACVLHSCRRRPCRKFGRERPEGWQAGVLGTAARVLMLATQARVFIHAHHLLVGLERELP